MYCLQLKKNSLSWSEAKKHEEAEPLVKLEIRACTVFDSISIWMYLLWCSIKCQYVSSLAWDGGFWMLYALCRVDLSEESEDLTYTYYIRISVFRIIYNNLTPLIPFSSLVNIKHYIHVCYVRGCTNIFPDIRIFNPYLTPRFELFVLPACYIKYRGIYCNFG